MYFKKLGHERNLSLIWTRMHYEIEMHSLPTINVKWSDSSRELASNSVVEFTQLDRFVFESSRAARQLSIVQYFDTITIVGLGGPRVCCLKLSL